MTIYAISAIYCFYVINGVGTMPHETGAFSIMKLDY